jgi:hypothetical protein
MLTVVIRSVANPDLYIPLQPGVLIEAKRLLFIRSNVCNLQECADYHHTSFECVETYSTKRVSVVTMKSYATRIRFMVAPNLPITTVEIGGDFYTIEIVDLIPRGKEAP